MKLPCVNANVLFFFNYSKPFDTFQLKRIFFLPSVYPNESKQHLTEFPNVECRFSFDNLSNPRLLESPVIASPSASVCYDRRSWKRKSLIPASFKSA